MPLHGQIELAVGHQRAHGRGAEAVANLDRLRRQRIEGIEIVGEGLQDRELLHVVGLDRVRPGACIVAREEGGAVVAVLAEIALLLVGPGEIAVHDREPGQRRQERSVGRGQRDPSGAIVHRGGREADEQVRIGLADRLGAGERVDDVVGVDHRPVMELRVPHRERVVQAVVAHFPGLGKQSGKRAVGIRPDKTVVNIEVDDRVDVIDRLVGIEFSDRNFLDTQYPFCQGGTCSHNERHCNRDSYDK